MDKSMTEVFKIRKNMTRHRLYADVYDCRDKNGKYICDGGPSQIWNKGHDWQFYDSKLGYHRLDGPATSNGRWFINNVNITHEIRDFAEENNIDLGDLSDEDKVMIALRFS